MNGPDAVLSVGLPSLLAPITLAEDVSEVNYAHSRRSNQEPS